LESQALLEVESWFNSTNSHLKPLKLLLIYVFFREKWHLLHYSPKAADMPEK